nr:PREDICTED: putative leucine-rich repeat-containing protein DDB_G0290503 isoform X1 [Megachile rotundata]
MPGIYVRKASWLDWTQKKENTIVTVPGSYWLCHKSNVYKFIFRYHRMTRNKKQFEFGKELMKVVRKIIKTQPRQGQQFSTTNLFVTYNYASWTRQDKMFAMIKFKERCGTVYSHAFVLTIKVCNVLEHTEQKIKHVVTIPDTDHCPIPATGNLNSVCSDKNNIERKSEKYLLNSCNNGISEKNVQCDNIQKNISESKTPGVQLDNSLNKTPTNKESVKQKANNENSTEVNNKVKENKSLKGDKLKENKLTIAETEKVDDAHNSNNLISLENKSNKDTKLCSGKINVCTTKSSNNRNTLILSDEREIGKKSIDCKTSLVQSKHNDKNTVVNTNEDSANLPYQYFIENEIENAKHEILDAESCLQQTTDKNLCDQREQNSKRHKLENINEDVKDLPSPKKRKFTIDNTTSRSSDITDLVMEGLMFTIRQGQDTVAVIEQKTKLEMDEVLENSEKIETQEGEKRLRNSSLLGLENLITMIDLPKQNENEHKCQNAIIQENILKNQSLSVHSFDSTKYSFNDVNITQENITSTLKYAQSKFLYNNSPLASTSFSNNNDNLFVTNTCKYNVTTQNVNYKQNEEGEEDIIPEVLQNSIFQSPIHSLKRVHKCEEKFIDCKDVLVNKKELTKFETLNDECISPLSKKLLLKECLNTSFSNDKFMKKSDTSHKLSDDNIKNKMHLPTIISDQSITMQEIPLPLQKMLKNKSPKKYVSLINKNEINKSNIEVHKEADNTHEKEEIPFNVQLEAKIINSNNSNDHDNTQLEAKILNNENDQNNSENESMLSTVSKIQTNDSSTSGKNMTKVEEVSSNEIKDITQEFYEDISYLQKKKLLHNEKYLRSKTKSLNVLSSANYGEMHIEMVKFFQDITRGAKVVVTRISTKEYT